VRAVNSWFYGRKGVATAGELWHLAALHGRQRGEVRAAWNTFREEDRLPFAALLRRSAAQLREVIATGGTTYRDPGIPEDFDF
jgi:hypothetical protein